MKQVAELTPGLLISMAMRLRHDFFQSRPFGMVSKPDNQIRSIRDAAIYYHGIKVLYERGFDFGKDNIPTRKQLLEEMLEEGFWNPGNEEFYQNSAHPNALKEAQQLATDKVSFDGPVPTLTVEDGGKIDGKPVFYD